MCIQKYLFSAVILLPVISTMPSHANTFADVELSYMSDDNRSRTNHAPDIRKDSSVKITADYGKFFDLSDSWSMTILGLAGLEQFSNYSAFDTTTIGANVAAKKKFGLGAYAHSLSLSLLLTSNDLEDNRRDNTATELTAAWGKRLNDKWELSAGFILENSSADNAVFDIKSTSLFASADYAVNAYLLLSFGITSRDGDIITVTDNNSNPLTQDATFIAQNFPWITDNSYLTAGADPRAYNINADTLILRIGANYAINDVSSVDASYEMQDSDVGYNTTYENNIIRANYLYAF